MSMPSARTAGKTVGNSLVTAAGALAVLTGIYTGAAYFGVDLPRPVWQDDLHRALCQIARINKDVYGRKLSREQEVHKRLLEESESLSTDDPQAYWKNRRERTASEEELARLHLIVDPAVETWKGCTP